MFGLDEDGLTQLREACLAATLDRIFAAHPYYRRVFMAAGIGRSDLRTLADIARLPITAKADYMADPQSFRLGPEGAADDEETVVWDVMYTTGSTGAPTPFVSTAYDFVNILALNRNMMRLRGVTAEDFDPQPVSADQVSAWCLSARAARGIGLQHSSDLGHARPRQCSSA